MMATAITRGESLSSLVQQATQVYKEKIDSAGNPEIASFAPGRVNLIGEHTDYNDGAVLPMAINQVTILVGRRRPSPNDGNCRLITLSGDLGQSDVSIPVPPPPSNELYNNPDARMDKDNTTWYRYIVGVVALMNRAPDGSAVGIPPFEVVIATNVPIGGGLSSSAALEVATSYFIERLCVNASITLPPRTQQERALLCQRAEHLYANAPCGIMDQFVCVLAEENKACYIDCIKPSDGGPYVCENVPLNIKEDDLVVMIINSQVKHVVSDGGYELRRDRCYEAARIMNAACIGGRPSLRRATLEDIEKHKAELSQPVDKGPTLYQCAVHVVNEIDRTIRAKQVLANGQYQEFGRLMNASHTSLKDDYHVSCEELDVLVDLVRQDTEGVYGSRMTGAGFGGCTVTLLKRTAVAGAVTRVTEGYFARNGLQPECYIVTPCCGGGIMNN